MLRPAIRQRLFKSLRRCYATPSSSSKSEDPELVPDKEAEQAKSLAQKTIVGRLLDKEISLFSGKEPMPFTGALPNKKGVEGYDPAIKLGEIADDGPKMLKEETAVSSSAFLAIILNAVHFPRFALEAATFRHS